ncbi:putative GPI anchored protein [Thermoascus aurantiacus ATCC 26904]
MKLSLVSLASLVPLAAAHFKLDYPPSRGFVEDTMPRFPCGGLAQSSNRTVLSLSEGALPVALTMGHSQTAVEILLGLGNDPGSNFNITLVPTFRLTGLGSFCLPHVPLDPKVLGTNLTDGANATLQVVTNGDPTGGLYACADITFSRTVASDTPTGCKNNTGVSATPFSGAAAARNANESTPDGQPQSGASASGTSTGTTAPSSTAGAAALETAAWGVVGAAIVGGLAVL